MLREGKSGWVLPIRRPEQFVARLEWCDAHRHELAQMARHVYDSSEQRDWSAVAEDFQGIYGGLSRATARDADGPVVPGAG
jgi:hypothetical protein